MSFFPKFWSHCFFVAALLVPTLLTAGTAQTISFEPPTERLSTAAPVALAATASSGLPVSYSIVSAGTVATVNGSTLTLTGTPGTVTVKASQAGNGSYDAAPEVFRSLTVVDAARRFVKVASSALSDHGAGIRADGTLWTWGSNRYGQLGDRTITSHGEPRQVGTATDWVAVACGNNHTLGVRGDGTLWAWGDNQHGQLGVTMSWFEPPLSTMPVRVGTATNWATVAASGTSSMAIRKDGTLWGWGIGYYGQLGSGTVDSYPTPVQIGTDTNWASVSMGSEHTAGIRTDGTLWTWGFSFSGALGDDGMYRNAPGQVGVGSTWTQVSCGYSHTLAIRSDGTLWGCGDDNFGKVGTGMFGEVSALTQVSASTNWVSASCGYDHSVGLRADGTLWGWGVWPAGTGLTTPIYDMVQIEPGTDWAAACASNWYTLALRSTGTLWARGLNTFGQLGNGGIDSTATPQQVGTGTTWTAVARGDEHSVALRADGTLWAWGKNNHGQLGDGTTTDRAQPVQVGTATTWAAVDAGTSHTVALRTDGSLWAWGHNNYGQLGTGSFTNATSPVRVGSATNWTAISCGAYHTCGLRFGGTLWSWGANSHGELGGGTTSLTGRNAPEQVGSMTNWASVSTGSSFTLAVRTDGTLWSWGYNDQGQLGDGTTTSRSSPAQVGTATNWASAAAGLLHALAVRTDGTLWSWGVNSGGVLGNSTTTDSPYPEQVGSNTLWTQVNCSSNNSAALRADGSLWIWGRNHYGQLGTGTWIDASAPVLFTGGGTWADVACGNNRTIARRADGTLWTAGGLDSSTAELQAFARSWPVRGAQVISPFVLPALSIGVPVTLPAVASSGLPITHTTSGPATLVGKVLTPTGTGPITVTASQPGNAAWQAAEAVMFTGSVEGPEIGVSGNGQSIANGDATPSTADHTDFGSVGTITGTVTRTFTVANTGAVPLYLGTVSVSGPQAGDFSVSVQPVSPVAAGGSTSFEVVFNPSAHGLRQATLGLTSNDNDEASISFAIVGLDANTAQEIAFPVLASVLSTSGPLPLAAVSSAGLPITYTVVSGGGVATLADGTLTFTGTPGAVTLRASQAGDSTYSAAPDVLRTLLVGDPARRYVKIASGAASAYSAGIRADGTLWLWGGVYGMGTGQPAVRQVGSASTWVDVDCGAQHLAAVRADGTLWGWGSNTYGQVGDGTMDDRLEPVQIGTETTWVSVSCGRQHSVARRADGTLWAWGNNNTFQLGAPPFGGVSRTPVQVGTATHWSAVDCGELFTLALRTDGTLWRWGTNPGTGSSNSQPIQVDTSTKWAAISGGYNHAAGVRTDGTLWAWGNNFHYQLGGGDNIGSVSSPVQVGTDTHWTSVACGADHLLARRADGTLWTWGRNMDGELGNGSFAHSTRPAQVALAGSWVAIVCGARHSMALRADGSLHAWGSNVEGQTGVGARRTPAQSGLGAAWLSASAGSDFTTALRTDGTAWASGANLDGQLGDSTALNRSFLTPVSGTGAYSSLSSGSAHTLAMHTDGTLWGWGAGYAYQLGNGSGGYQYAPAQAGIVTTWAAVETGAFHTAALRTDGSLWTWGRNSDGQLGVGNTTYSTVMQQIGTDTWQQASAGDFHTAAVRTDGTLWAWGENASGAVGDGTTTRRTSPTQVGSATHWAQVSCGRSFTLALRTDGTLWAWGSNPFGVLGDGTTTDRLAPGQVGTATTWVAVDAGTSHCVALRADGTLWAWGLNEQGQLGDGTLVSRSHPVQIGTSTNWRSASVGRVHTVAVRTDNTLWTWGEGPEGALGEGPDSRLPHSLWPERAPQELSFSALSSLAHGQSISLGATTTSGLPVIYTVTGPATLTGNTLTATGPGRVTVAAYQAGDLVWAGAEPVIQTLLVQGGLTAHQSWRQAHFGTTANTGAAADTYDADHDGLANLIEYAFGLLPQDGGSVQLPAGQRVGNTFTVSFTEPSGVTGVTYGAQHSASLQSGSWTPVPDTGSGTTHVFSVTVGEGEAAGFIQLSVTAAP